MTAGAIRAGKAVVEASIDDKNFGPRLKMLEAKLMGFGKGIQSIGQRLKGFGSSMAMGSTLAAIPAALSVGEFMRFDDVMRTVKASAEATDEQFESMTAKARELAESTGYAATEVGGLMIELARANYNPRQIEQMAEGILNLARATGTDVTTSSETLSKTLSQFMLGAEDAVMVSDFLTAAANKSLNSIESLREALEYAGPVAQDANMSLEDTLAILGKLGDSGIQGSEAGTALRRLLTVAEAESEKFQELFGVKTLDGKGNVRNLIDIMEEVTKATAGMGTGTRAEALNDTFGLLSITSASIIMKNIDAIRELRTEIDNSSGAAEKAAADMNSGIGGSWRKMTSAIESFKLEVGKSLSGISISAFSALTTFANSMTALVEKNPQLAQMFALIVSGGVATGIALFGAGTALTVIGAGIAALATTISSVVAVMSTVGLPIVAIAAGITAIGAALALVAGAGIAVTAMFVDWGTVWGYLKNIWNSFADPISAQIENVLALLKDGKVAKAAELFMLSVGLGMVRGARSLRQSLIPVWMEIAKANVKAFNWMIRNAADFRQGFIKALTSGEGTELSVSNFLDPVDMAFASIEKSLTQRIGELQGEAEAVRQKFDKEWKKKLSEASLIKGGGNEGGGTASPADMANAEIQAQLSAMMADREAMVSSIRDGFDRMTAETHGTWSGSAQLPLTRVIDRQVELLESIDTNIDRIASREPAVLDWDE